MSTGEIRIIASISKEPIIKRYVIDRLPGILEQAKKNVMPIILRDQEKIIKDAIKHYYQFPRKYYKRTKSLFNVYKMEEDSFSFSASFMPDVHRASNDYIYQKMFVEGYHGGSNGIGDPKPDLYGSPKPWSMAFRTPVNNQYDIPAFSAWSNMPPKKSEISPYDEIKKNLQIYGDKGKQIFFKEILRLLAQVIREVK